MLRRDDSLEHRSEAAADRTTSRWLRLAMVGVSAVALAVVPVSRAGADPAPSFFLRSNEGTGCAGGTTPVYGRDFAPDSQYTVTTTVGTLSLSSVTAHSDGTLGVALSIPLGTAAGSHIVVQAHPVDQPSQVTAEEDLVVQGPHQQFPGADISHPVPVGGTVNVTGSCFVPGEPVSISSDQVQLGLTSVDADQYGAVNELEQVVAVRKSGQPFITLTGMTSGVHVVIGFSDSYDTLAPGASLGAQWNGQLVSPSSHYHLLLTDKGLLVGRAPSATPQTTDYDIVWSSSPSAAFGSLLVGLLIMQTDGNLVLFNGSHAVWSSGTRGTGTANRAVMQDDGNLVIYTAAGKAVWSSRYGRVRPPTPILAAGHTLSPGQTLTNGKYHALLLVDGNFVVYGHSVWQSHTTGRGGTRLALQSSGDLVLYTASGRSVWSSHTAASRADRLELLSNGNLVLYTATNQAVWSSHTF